MSAGSDAALLAALEAALPPGSVTRGDVDPRTAASPTGRPVGAPAAWTRPADVTQLAAVARVAAARGRPVVAVGEASTYWDPLRVEGAVVVDTRALVTPSAADGIDPRRRTARVGAGVRVRDLDRAARAHGLALAAHPDNAGITSVGSLLAMGCSAGLGMGRAFPIDLITGATVVTGAGKVLHLGTSHALAGLGYTRHGLPDALGPVASAEGSGALIAEVSLLLEPAPFIATVTARGDRADAPSPALIDDFLRLSRRALDEGDVDSLRVEAVTSEEFPGVEHSAMARAFSRRSARDATERARALGEALEAAGLRDIALLVETDDERRGVEPDYARHWISTEERVRNSLALGAFWGVDVITSWGAELDETLVTLHALFARVASHDPLVRRIGVYPGHHTLSSGLQVIGRRGAAEVDALAATLGATLPGLLAAGAVPYRVGHLWRDAVDAHLAAAGRGDTAVVLRAALRALDPDGRLGS